MAHQAVMACAEATTATPLDVTDEMVAELREHLTDAVVELAGLIALENQRSGTNSAPSHTWYPRFKHAVSDIETQPTSRMPSSLSSLDSMTSGLRTRWRNDLVRGSLGSPMTSAAGPSSTM